MKVSIIIPTYTNSEDFKLCLASVIKYTDLTNSEIIVIANGAPEETREYVNEKLKDTQNLKLWWFDGPLGYTKSINIGIEKSLGELVLFLNDDCQILESESNEWIERLSKPFEDYKIQATGLSENYSPEIDGNFLVGYCLMVRKDYLNNHGYLDEIFNPGYNEDIELCNRIRRTGLEFMNVSNNTDSYDNKIVGDFPLFHDGEKTFKELHKKEDQVQLINRNNTFLKEKIKLHSNISDYNKFVYDEIFIINSYDALAKELQDSIIIDIGANVGSFSIFAKELRAKKIYAFEPSHNTYKNLVENTKNYDNIHTYNLAVTEKANSEVYMMDDSVESDIWKQKDENVLPTKTITLDEIGEMVPTNKMVLKIDCEGSEFDIIYSTSPKLLKRFSYIYLEVHNKLNPNYIDKHEELLQYIKDLGFNLTQGPVMGVFSPDGNFTPSPVTTWKCENRNNEVSIIIPTHKRPDQLRQALNSILTQTYRKIKVLVVADGKDDIVKNIVNEYDKHSSDISFNYYDVPHEGNSGSKPRIHGIEQLAEHGFTCFLDDDNTMFPDYIEEMLNNILNNNLSISVCQILLNNEYLTNDIIPKTPAIKFREIDSLNFMVSNKIAKQYKEKWLNTTDEITHDFDFISECTRFNQFSLIPRVLGIHNWSNNDVNNNEESSPKNKIIATVSTRGRYFTTLPACLLAIANQTHTPDDLFIFDDEAPENKVDLRTIEIYDNIFKLLDMKKINWRVVFAKGLGQVVNHESAYNIANDDDLIWRLDDDNVPESNVLETLLSHMTATVGAVGGLILDPKNDCSANPKASNDIKDISSGLNEQWFYPVETFKSKKVDHLYSSFLYRKKAAPNGYCKELSRVGHREETIFTYEITLNGYDNIFTPECTTWHFQNQVGGIRDNTKAEMWEHDEEIFKKKMVNWGKNIIEPFPIVLANGIGDHYAVKYILPKIQEKHKEIIIYCSHPEVFEGEDIKIKTIDEALEIFNNIEYWNIYQFMDITGWSGHLINAFEKLYGI